MGYYNDVLGPKSNVKKWFKVGDVVYDSHSETNRVIHAIDFGPRFGRGSDTWYVCVRGHSAPQEHFTSARDDVQIID